MIHNEPRLEVAAGDIDAVIDIEASPEHVFAAISDPRQLVQWWGADQIYKPSQWECDLRAGGRWRSEGVAPGGQTFFVQGEYLEIEAPRLLAYTWNVSWAPLPTTEVRWEITEIEGGVRVHVTHKGFGENEAQARSHAQAATGGWAAVLAWLRKYLLARRAETLQARACSSSEEAP
jgi:uncharacterized protein YndB with AHSA1/START domain